MMVFYLIPMALLATGFASTTFLWWRSTSERSRLEGEIKSVREEAENQRKNLGRQLANSYSREEVDSVVKKAAASVEETTQRIKRLKEGEYVLSTISDKTYHMKTSSFVEDEVWKEMLEVIGEDSATERVVHLTTADANFYDAARREQTKNIDVTLHGSASTIRKQILDVLDRYPFKIASPKKKKKEDDGENWNDFNVIMFRVRVIEKRQIDGIMPICLITPEVIYVSPIGTESVKGAEVQKSDVHADIKGLIQAAVEVEVAMLKGRPNQKQSESPEDLRKKASGGVRDHS